MNKDAPDTLIQPEKAEQLRTRLIRVKNLIFSWWWILAITVAGAVVVQAWLVFSQPVEYQSNSKIIVSGRISLPDGALFNEEAVNFYGTQKQLMESAEVRKGAAHTVQSLNPNLSPVPVYVIADQIPRSSIFVLSATGGEKEYVRAYLDAVMTSYIAVRRGMFSEKSQNTLTAITDELVHLEKDLRDNEQELLDWQRKNNLVFLKEEGNSAGIYLATLNRKMALLETEYRLLETLSLDQNLDRSQVPGMATVEGRNNENINSDLVDAFGNSGPATEYLNARRKLNVMQAEVESMLQTKKPEHPKIIDLKTQITQQLKLIEILRQQSLDQLSTRKDALRIQIENTKTQITEWEGKALDLSRRMGEFDRLKGKVERQKGLYERLLGSVQSVDVNANIQQDIVSIMEYATQAQELRPAMARELFTAAVVGLLIGAGVLFLIGLLDDRIVSISELQSVFTQEVVGVIPKANMENLPILLENDDRVALVEAFRNLRSWLFFTPWEGTPPKTFLVTSAIPEEGKSTIAANLAVSLASSGAKTLLVDADLRRGRLHSRFGIDGDPGFGDVLSGDATAKSAVISSSYANLSLLSKGRFVSPRNEVFFGASFDHFLAEIVKEYDYVIFDSCPMLAVDDTSSLAPKVDVVFFVIRCNYTSIRLARKSLNVLEARRANVQGIIYNAVDWSAADYPYYRYGYAATGTKGDKIEA